LSKFWDFDKVYNPYNQSLLEYVM